MTSTLVAALLLVTALVTALPTIRGVDTPLLTRAWKGPASEGIDNAFAKVTCRAYPRFAVVETDDPGLRGLKALVVRVRAPGMKSRALCAESFTGESRDVRREDTYLAGVRGDVVILQGADLFGEMGESLGFELIDARTGETTWKGLLDANARVKASVDPKTGAVSLSNTRP